MFGIPTDLLFIGAIVLFFLFQTELTGPRL